MSNQNKHSYCAPIYVKEYLGPVKYCTKRSCSGKMVEVFVRYKDHGPIRKEFECTSCGRTMKDYSSDEDEGRVFTRGKRRGRHENR